MPETCPKCGSTQIGPEHPYPELHCWMCGWYEQPSNMPAMKVEGKRTREPRVGATQL